MKTKRKKATSSSEHCDWQAWWSRQQINRIRVVVLLYPQHNCKSLSDRSQHNLRDLTDNGQQHRRRSRQIFAELSVW